MIRVFVCVVMLFSCSLLWAAENIKIGMSVALTGPVAEIGKNMRTGVESYFEIINQQGGINGRLLELIVIDDGYEPERAAANMRKLINDDGVLAVIGNVGTPTAIVTAPIAEEKKTLLFGAFSGADVLREIPPSRYIINYRASYAEETAEMIRGLLSAGIQPKQIAFFTQRDGYGDAGYRGAINALNARGYGDTGRLTHVRYTRNTLNVEDAVASILDMPIPPKVVIMAGGYSPSAKFITLLQQDIPNIWFLNLSFVGSHALKKTLAKDVENVVVTQVVPSLTSSLPVVQEYLSVLENNIEANDVSLEGFIIAKIFCQALFAIEDDINKENIIDSFESIQSLDIGLGQDIYYDKTEHQAMHDLWLTQIKAGKFKDFVWEMIQTVGQN